MSNHDWDALYGELERATGAWTREELVALMRDLIREYVIERGLPTGTPAQATTPDLGAMDFPQLIGWLKRSLDLPELELFSVDGRRVLVEADGPRVLTANATRRPTGQWPATRGAPPPPAASAEGDTAPYPAASGPQPAPPLPSDEPDDGGDGREPSARKLSRGFRGLEFD